MTGPGTYRHKPTIIHAMQFTPANLVALDYWLKTSGVDYEMTPEHLLISTTQGDARDIGLGGWVIRRPVSNAVDVYEFYPVEDEVMNDYEPAGGEF